MMSGYMPAVIDPRKPTAASGTLRTQDRGEARAALLEHGLTRGEATGLLDFAGLNGDGAVFRARVEFDGATWTVDLFGPKAEAA